MQSCRRRYAVRRCSNIRIAIRNHASNRRWSRLVHTSNDPTIRDWRNCEPEYVGQIAVQYEHCLALHVRDEDLRDRFVRVFHASWFITVSVMASALILRLLEGSYIAIDNACKLVTMTRFPIHTTSLIGGLQYIEPIFSMIYL